MNETGSYFIECEIVNCLTYILPQKKLTGNQTNFNQFYLKPSLIHSEIYFATMNTDTIIIISLTLSLTKLTNSCVTDYWNMCLVSLMIVLKNVYND